MQDCNCVYYLSRETILREYLNTVLDQYDFILLDCCPSLGMLTINALSAADEILIPMQAHYLSLKGMEQLMRTIGRVKRQINPNLTISFAGNRGTASGYIRRPVKNFRHYHPPLHPCSIVNEYR